MGKNKFFTGFCDMHSGKPLETGHIVAVRYVWNSYVGEIVKCYDQYQLFASGHLNMHFLHPIF
jgi:hypothetical protein